MYKPETWRLNKPDNSAVSSWVLPQTRASLISGFKTFIQTQGQRKLISIILLIGVCYR